MSRCAAEPAVLENPKMKLRASLIIAACALALGGCDKIDKLVDGQVQNYLASHPAAVQEALDNLQDKQTRLAINQYRAALEHDSRDFVANPNGKVTVTEFYDYRCPHCVNAAPAVVSMIHDNPDVRFVFKEFPIFGPVSEKAAAGAMAVKAAGGDYVGLYRDFMAARPLDEAAIDRILAAHGVQPASLDEPDARAAHDAQLLAVRRLAVSLGAEGTPAFVVGDTMIPGDNMPALDAAIKKAREAKPS
jgi:protein-disulfide isomerase